jgi:hypothetical protein
MATLTINHYINQANSFITDIRDNRNGYYMFVSRPQPWANSSGGNNDTVPVSTNNSVAQVEQSLYYDLLYGKLLFDSDVINVIPRYNWVSNTIYGVYDQNDADLYSKQFYVVTDKYEVYKCIDNNNGEVSYVKPTLTTTSGTFKTGDGYIWKYMYSIDAYSNSKFTTTNYIPVITNTAVQGNTTPGSIDVIKITDGGNSYFVYETGYIGGMVDRSIVQLPATASNTDDYYVKSSIYLKSGFGAGQIREISSSNGTSKQIVVNQPFETFARLDLSNISGTVETGYFVEQPYDEVNYLYTQGYFNIDSTVTQSDTGASGKILAANTSVLQITRYVANTLFQNGFPIIDAAYSGTVKTGTVSVGNVGACNLTFITSAGSGYTSNATVTITANGSGSGATANAQANSTGKISAINITAAGNSYFVAPTLTISSPPGYLFNSNTSVANGVGGGSNNVITLPTWLGDIVLSGSTASGYNNNDIITVKTPTANATNATVTFTTNSTGGSLTFTITNVGSGFNVGTVPVSNIAITNATGGTAAGNSTVTYLVANVTSSAASFVANDLITYTRSTGNTANIGLTPGVSYYVEFANTTVVALKTSPTGSRISLTKGATESGHILQGQTATAVMYCDNQIVYGANTQLNDTANGYTIGEYIRIGANTTSNIRRVANTVNTTVLIADLPFKTSFAATGSVNTISLSGATASGYNNNDIITIKSPIVGSTNATVTFTTNSTGGSLTFTITNAGSGFVLGNVPVSNIAVTNATGGTAAGNSTATYLIANVSSANSHYKMPVTAEPASIVIYGANGYVSDTNLTSVQVAISNSTLLGVYFSVGEKVNMTNSSLINQGANAIIAFSNSSTVILSSVSGTWQVNSGGTQFYVSGESSLQKSQIVSVQSNPNITINDPTGTFKLGYPVYFKTAPTSSSSGNATLVAKITLPNDQTEYLIGPTVKVTGDGSNAVAIAVVNTAANSKYDIVGVDIINPGSGYTQANVSIYANTNYGSGATAKAIISPVYGHGYDAVTELGGRYVAVDVKFDTIANEGYKFLGYGTYRKVGILQNPQFKDVKVTLTDFDRINFTLNASSYSTSGGGWTAGEVVLQSTTNAAGVVVYGNSSFLQLKSVKGAFNVSNTIHGYYSNSTANVRFANTIYFPVGNSAEIITQSNSGSVGVITSVVNNTVYFMSNVVGQFETGSTIYDSVVNAYATVSSIYTSNGTVDVSSNFAHKFNQTARITITANTGAFSNNEYVQQDISLASGRIVSTNNEKDLKISIISGTFAVGQTITDTTTNANGICTFANSTYLKLTAISSSLLFGDSHTINNGLGSTATVSNVYPVMVLSDVSDVNNFQAGSNAIIGQTSGASATCNNYLLITNPDLVRDSGKMIYTESFTPVTRSATSSEEVKLIIKF